MLYISKTDFAKGDEVMDSKQFEEIRNKNPFMTLNDIVYDLLLQEIITFGLAPGSKIYESNIASSLGVSRSPVKYALERLQEVGYVRILNNRYYVVDFTRREYLEMFDLTRILETYGAREAAVNATQEEINELYHKSNAINKLYKNAQHDSKNFTYRILLNAEIDFHHSLVKASHNETVANMYDSLRYKIFFCRGYLLYTRPDGFYDDLDTDHSYICDAINYHDKDMAAAAIQHHLGISRKGIERYGLLKGMK